MAKSRLDVSVAKTSLSDETFRSRVSRNFLGDVKKNLNVELHDLSLSDEAEALALVLASENIHAVFRVDRQSLGLLADSLNEVLERGRSEIEVRAA